MIYKNIILILMLSVSLLNTSCETPPSPAPGSDECGGRSIAINENAPTTVESTDMKYIELSVTSYEIDGWIYINIQPWGEDIDYMIAAKDLSDEDVKTFENAGYYAAITANNVDLFFPTTKDTLNKIGKAIVDSGLINSNGIRAWTDGIPPDSGTASVTGEFDSGEKLDYAGNSMDWDPRSIDAGIMALKIMLPEIEQYYPKAISNFDSIFENYENYNQ